MNFKFCLLLCPRFKKEWVLTIPNPENDNVVDMGHRIKSLQTKEAKNNFCPLADCFYTYFLGMRYVLVPADEFFKDLSIILSFKIFIFFH